MTHVACALQRDVVFDHNLYTLKIRTDEKDE